MEHKKFLISSAFIGVLSMTLCVLSSVINFNGRILSTSAVCGENNHIGNHYNGKPAETLKSGCKEYYVCCKCHEKFDTNPGGTWTEKGDLPSETISKEHFAYIEPTVTKAQVEEKLAALESTVAINTIPSAIDKYKYEQAVAYKNAYLSKEDSVSEAELSGIDNFYGADNVFKYKNSSKISIKINEWNVHTREDLPLIYNQIDSDTGIEYTRYSITKDLTGWNFLYYYQGGILKDLPDKPLQVLIRSNLSFNVYSAVNDGTNWHYGIKTALVANEWTAITFNAEQVALIKSCGYDSGSYYGNSVRIHLSDQSGIVAGSVVDFTTFYYCSGTDLTEYNLLSNETYNYGGCWNLGGVTGTMSYNLQSNNIWFSDVAKAENNKTDYRNNFIELKYSNTTGEDKTRIDFTWSGGNNYANLYYSLGSAFNKKVNEMFFMVYANMQTDIYMSTLYSICYRYGSNAGKTVINEKVLYKGWNLLHLTIPQGGLDINYSSGHFFSLVPEVWKNGVELTIAGLFYKAVE